MLVVYTDAITFLRLDGNTEKQIEQSVPKPEFRDPTIIETNNPKTKKCEYVNKTVIRTVPVNPKDNIQKNIGYQNNKVGLYIYAEVREYTSLASQLTNSNGGDWGYVLIPFNVKDTDERRWMKLFRRLQQEHLIPIIQFWDLDLTNISERDKQIRKSAEFLNKLEWPIKPRYISVYNEPNDANFWKGKVNPAEYAEILEKTINTFKALDKNYFILNGAFNASARSGKNYIDERLFLIRMNDQVPGIFRRLDGWASHSYPQPNFSGSPKSSGRDSIRAYEWELSLLKRYFGVTKIPVFITETGWAHKEDANYQKGDKTQYLLDQYQVADNIKYAFKHVWMPDARVVAVTPFTIKYAPPYDNFSWITQNGSPYPQFEAVKNIKKIKGKPPIVTYHKTKVLKCE